MLTTVQSGTTRKRYWATRTVAVPKCTNTGRWRIPTASPLKLKQMTGRGESAKPDDAETRVHCQTRGYNVRRARPARSRCREAFEVAAMAKL